MGYFINWNTVPMTFNDSWSYLEMLGKCVTQIDTNTRNIENNRQNIETNRQNIEINTQNIETNRQNIETNSDNIATNRNMIDALALDLEQNYYTKAECDAKFVNGDDYYNISEIDDILEGYAGIEYVDDEIYDLYVKINQDFATKEMINSNAIDAIKLRKELENNGLATYYKYDADRFAINENVVTTTLIPTEFAGVTFNLTYSVTTSDATINVCESIHVKRGETAKRFVMYSMALGGTIEAVNTSDNNFTITVANPTGTEVINITDISTIVYTASKIISSEAEKQKWFEIADCCADGAIDETDASRCLDFYAWLTTDGIDDMYAGNTLDELWVIYCQQEGYVNYSPYAPDVNLDGKVDSLDVSLILSFISYVSAGGDGSVDGWYNWITGQINY